MAKITFALERVRQGQDMSHMWSVQNSRNNTVNLLVYRRASCISLTVNLRTTSIEYRKIDIKQ